METPRFSSSDEHDLDVQSEINVTPFIDVILVLLIIFMVAAPLSTVDVPVNLPAATVKPAPRPEKPTFVTITTDKQFSVGEIPVQRDRLITEIVSATNGDREKRLFVRADKAALYGDVLQVLDDVRNAGYLRIGLVALEARQALGAEPSLSPRE
jgi:biopolymer transport protein ExbD